MALLFVFRISYSLFFPISFPQYCFNGFLAECDAFVEVFSGDVERRVEVDDVTHRTEDEAFGHGFTEDMPADSLFSREGFLCGRVFYEFDGVDEADVADFAYVLMMAEGFHEFFVEVLAVFVDFVQDVIAFHDFQDFEGDGAAHRVACVGVAVDEGFVP